MLCIWTRRAYFSCTVVLQSVSSPNIKALGTRWVESSSLTDNASLLCSSIHTRVTAIACRLIKTRPSGPGLALGCSLSFTVYFVTRNFSHLSFSPHFIILCLHRPPTATSNEEELLSHFGFLVSFFGMLLLLECPNLNQYVNAKKKRLVYTSCRRIYFCQRSN